VRVKNANIASGDLVFVRTYADAVGSPKLLTPASGPYTVANRTERTFSFKTPSGPIPVNSDRVTKATSTGRSSSECPIEDVEGSKAPENEFGELRGTGETASRPVGTKQAKRRKLDHARDSKLAEAVSYFVESQRKRLEDSKRRNNIALVQSEDVPEDMRKAFFRAMERKLLDESGVELSVHSATTQSEDEE
jgi:hypothetical protein